jgi:hypothetical protein
MTSPTERAVLLPSSLIERAAKLAPVMTADVHATDDSDPEWTALDVINVALGRGLDALEREYLGQGR